MSVQTALPMAEGDVANRSCRTPDPSLSPTVNLSITCELSHTAHTVSPSSEAARQSIIAASEHRDEDSAPSTLQCGCDSEVDLEKTVAPDLPSGNVPDARVPHDSNELFRNTSPRLPSSVDLSSSTPSSRELRHPMEQSAAPHIERFDILLPVSAPPTRPSTLGEISNFERFYDGIKSSRRAKETRLASGHSAMVRPDIANLVHPHHLSEDTENQRDGTRAHPPLARSASMKSEMGASTGPKRVVVRPDLCNILNPLQGSARHPPQCALDGLRENHETRTHCGTYTASCRDDDASPSTAHAVVYPHLSNLVHQSGDSPVGGTAPRAVSVSPLGWGTYARSASSLPILTPRVARRHHHPLAPPHSELPGSLFWGHQSSPPLPSAHLVAGGWEALGDPLLLSGTRLWGPTPFSCGNSFGFGEVDENSPTFSRSGLDSVFPIIDLDPVLLCSADMLTVDITETGDAVFSVQGAGEIAIYYEDLEDAPSRLPDGDIVTAISALGCP